MNTVAFVVGLISLGLVAADVSHLRQNQGQHTYHANNGQAVQQSFNSRGQATYSSSSYNAGSPREVNNFFGQQAQQSSSCADSNSACVAQKSCNNGFIDQSAENKAVRSPSGRCYAPEVCCRFAQRRSAAYNLDNDVAAAGSTSEVLTAEGYVVKKPSNQYLPSYDQAPSNNNNNFIPPAPRPTQPRPTPPRTQPPVYTTQQQYRPTPPPPRPQVSYQPQPTNNRPVIQYDPAPVIVPIGCSAAMVCTNIQYCSASGVISKSPVSLSPEQELFRVPLTDCRKPDTKEVGKCCRDPDYTDPWPVGRTGQYVPEELNKVFDNGGYKPEPSAIKPVRVKVEQEGYVVPQPSNNQARLYLPPKSNRI